LKMVTPNGVRRRGGGRSTRRGSLFATASEEVGIGLVEYQQGGEKKKNGRVQDVVKKNRQVKKGKCTPSL